MREQLEKRVGQLKAEHEAGEQMLAELEAKEAGLRQTLLRISGAIQVLEELLAAGQAANGDHGLAPQPSHASPAAAAGHPPA